MSTQHVAESLMAECRRGRLRKTWNLDKCLTDQNREPLGETVSGLNDIDDDDDL